ANLSGIFTILVIFTTLKVYSEDVSIVAPFIALGIMLRLFVITEETLLMNR
ncbi:hypothetical protein H6A04_13145, partial [Fusobacterium mortiferum]|nr:hypothetical protein [Fusobacterium mortiferum]